MRQLPILSVVFLTAATPVFAQVTVDLHALQALPERPPANPPSTNFMPAKPPPNSPQPANPDSVTQRPSPPAASRAPIIVRREAPATTLPTATPPASTPASPPSPQPEMPETVPDTASIAPITPQAPPPSAQAPPPPPISESAATAAAPTTAGLRLTFAPGASDLSPESDTSIKQLTAAAPSGDSTTFNVLAYAPGKPDDPSTARRISLSRAMAVRSALVADGVPSSRIFVRALGEQFGDGPPDRVDLSVTGGNATANSATQR